MPLMGDYDAFTAKGICKYRNKNWFAYRLLSPNSNSSLLHSWFLPNPQISPIRPKLATFEMHHTTGNLNFILSNGIEQFQVQFPKFHYTSWKLVQVNNCQKLLFLHQLTHDMTTNCSLHHQFSTWKFQAQNMLCTQIVCFCFDIQNNMYWA